jgi:hypothetical protein
MMELDSGVFLSMSKISIDLNELDWKFVYLQRGAEALHRGFASLDDSTFNSFLSDREAGSTYCSSLYQRLLMIYTDYWKFRLALLWDLFPGQRAAALGYCQRKFEEATEAMAKLQRERPRDGEAEISEELARARVLFFPAKKVSTEAFVEGMTVPADRYAFYSSWYNGLDEWGTFTAFYQNLELTMVPELLERRRIHPRDWKRR